MNFDFDFDFLRSNFAFNFLRYLFGAGIFYVILVMIVSRLQPQARINTSQLPNRSQMLKEMMWSISSCLIFVAGTYVTIVLLKDKGWTLLYSDISTFGYPYFVFSILFCVLLHDLTFYLSHRLLHTRFLIKHVHYVHHSFKNPTVFAIWAVHPLEAVMYIIIAMLPAFIIPLHAIAFFIYVLITQLFNLIGHSGVELFPKTLNDSKFFKYLNSPTHHNMHHRFTHYSFGLYSRIWDTLFKTNHPDYEREFRKHGLVGSGEARSVSKRMDQVSNFSHK